MWRRQQSTANNDISGFGLSIFSAGGGPGSGVGGFGLSIFPAGGGPGSGVGGFGLSISGSAGSSGFGLLIFAFQWYATNYIKISVRFQLLHTNLFRIPVIAHKFD